MRGGTGTNIYPSSCFFMPSLRTCSLSIHIIHYRGKNMLLLYLPVLLLLHLRFAWLSNRWRVQTLGDHFHRPTTIKFSFEISYSFSNIFNAVALDTLLTMILTLCKEEDESEKCLLLYLVQRIFPVVNRFRIHTKEVHLDDILKS